MWDSSTARGSKFSDWSRVDGGVGRGGLGVIDGQTFKTKNRPLTP